MSRNSKEKAAYFRSLHRAGQPLALFNVWDAGSARTVADAGGVALATGSRSHRRNADARRTRAIRRGTHQSRAVPLPAGDEGARGSGEARRLATARDG